MAEITLIKSDLCKQGGLEKYTLQIAGDFLAQGHSVTLLTSNTKKAPLAHPLLKVVSLPLQAWLSYQHVLQFDKLCAGYLEEHPTPIIFSLDRNRFQTHIRAGNGVHIAYLERRKQEEGLLKAASFALNPLHRLILELEKKAFEHPGLKKLFTNSHMVRQEVLSYYNIDPNKIEVVHNGVNWQGLKEAFEGWESEKKKVFQFLFIGHNYKRKGLEPLLHSLSLIKNEEFELTVIGKEKNLPYFKHLAQSLGLQDKVFFLGPQERPLPFYQSADCMVVPSFYDPFANVTLEALAMGVYTLSSTQNGGHEILTKENGAIFPTLEDVSSMAEVLRAALRRPKTALSAQGIRDSVQHLDFSSQLRKLTVGTLNDI